MQAIYTACGHTRCGICMGQCMDQYWWKLPKGRMGATYGMRGKSMICRWAAEAVLTPKISPSKWDSRGCRGSMWVCVDVQVELGGGCSGEIRQGWGVLTPDRRIPSEHTQYHLPIITVWWRM
jgi:hypothetical protein